MNDTAMKPGTKVKLKTTGRRGTVVQSLDDQWAQKGYVRVIWTDSRVENNPGAIIHPDTLAPEEPEVMRPRGIVMDDQLWVNGRRKERY